MMTSSNEDFSALLAIFPGEFPSKRPLTRSFDVNLRIINGWLNNCEAGDLRRHRVQYDVIVMKTSLRLVNRGPDYEEPYN